MKKGMRKINQGPINAMNIVLGVIVLSLVGWWLYVDVSIGIPFHARSDPAMAYFIDSLGAFQGREYAFYQHPGTPVTLLGTILLSLTYPFLGGSIDAFTLFHLQNPHVFLTMAHAVLILGSIATLLSLSKHTFSGEHWTDQLVSAAIAVLYFLLFPQAFRLIMTWSHNSFSFPAGALLSLVLLQMLRCNQALSRKQQILLGACTGVLAATQLHFAAWTVGTIGAICLSHYLLGEDRRSIFLACLQTGFSALGGFILVTLPIWKHYPAFFAWVLGILSHQGPYGSGAPGFTSKAQFALNFMELWRGFPLLFSLSTVILVALGITLFLQRKKIKQNIGYWSAAFGLSVQLVVSIALIGKHPNSLYLQSVAAILPVLLGIAIALSCGSKCNKSPTFRLVKFGFSIMVLIGFFLNLSRAVIDVQTEQRQIDTAMDVIDDFLDGYAESHLIPAQDIARLWTYGMPSDCVALWYGNAYSGYGLSDSIMRICSGDYELDLWNNVVNLPDGTTVPPDQVDWDVIITAEAAVLEFPYLESYGDLVFTDTQLGTFGRVVFIVTRDD